jgi:hypothetical protein
MSKEREIAESYRMRAEEARIIARGDQDYETRDILEPVAADYDRMAVTMDEIAKTNEAMRRGQ